ncbi:hypothetical protein MES5069_110112 [Mesorhizobium escarrei]|uniref:Transposase n=1 Tax=Mesorhizobium escarrei TaxID=666018 RepID=A0ABM9DIC4_9HYPH|nr:hypothetical protein MES5069_110112 [Mesorhizobium escarrei]
MIGFAAERLMALEVGRRHRAGHGEKNPRCGRPSATATASGIGRPAPEPSLRIAKLRKGSYFPGFVEPRRMAENDDAS